MSTLEHPIQHASPGENAERNGLPATEGGLNMALRIDRPKPTPLSIHDGN